MRLDISHFAKIKKASIKLDGITVIAGENNTGKSTVGRILFCMFNSLYRIEDEIIRQREDRIVRILSYGVERMQIEHVRDGARGMVMSRRVRRKKYTEAAEEIVRLPNEERRRYIQKFYGELQAENEEYEIGTIIQEVAGKVEEALEISDEKIGNSLIKLYFSKCFANQMNDVYAPDSEAVAELNIKDQSVEICFSPKEGVRSEYRISILHEAICIDSPLVLDYMNIWEFTDGISLWEEHLVEKLVHTDSEDILEGILVNTKLQQIFELLDSVTTGKIIKEESGEFVLQEQGDASFGIQNLSMGIKAFSIIRMLLEKGILKERDVLILDEPEIHLHPEWQLVYAEVIVLLEKYFDLTILVTTHSPYFLEAIETYAKVHGVQQNTNYYLTEKAGKEIVINEVTGRLEEVYRLMSAPFAKLESIQYSE